MEDFFFGDVGVALGGCRGEDAVAFVERLERFVKAAAILEWSVSLSASPGGGFWGLEGSVQSRFTSSSTHCAEFLGVHWRWKAAVLTSCFLPFS